MWRLLPGEGCRVRHFSLIEDSTRCNRTMLTPTTRDDLEIGQDLLEEHDAAMEEDGLVLVPVNLPAVPAVNDDNLSY